MFFARPCLLDGVVDEPEQPNCFLKHLFFEKYRNSADYWQLAVSFAITVAHTSLPSSAKLAASTSVS